MPNQNKVFSSYLILSYLIMLDAKQDFIGIDAKQTCIGVDAKQDFILLRGCVKAVSSRFVSCELLPFVIVYVMTLYQWKRTLHG